MNQLLIDRTQRRPVHVRVVTSPAIARCWSVNLSQTGIGLVGSPLSEQGPQEGESLALELLLPGGSEPVHARGQVRWRHNGVKLSEHASTAFGVVFTGFDEDGALRVARYLESAPVRVAVAHADEATRAMCLEVLGAAVHFEFGQDHNELEVILGRGDISALVVCGEDEVQALLLTQLTAAVTENNLTFEGRPRDLAARVVLCVRTDPAHVAQLFDEKKIHRWLPPPFTAAALREAIVDACAEHASRLEAERMSQELERNLQRERALRDGPRLLPPEEGPGFQSPKMQQVLEQVRTVAPYKVSVLLQGETGTGKEVLSRIIHRLSDRRDGPFVVQDCGTLTETLLESELFGHVRGAFTGAVADHPGLFVLGHGGTLFLDEIENTTPSLQAKLLRVLETGEIRAVGGSTTRRVDVRVVSASNRALSEEVKAGRFRADLFYRLNTFTIELAPLRERLEDVVSLSRFFVEGFNHQHRKSVMGLSVAAERALLANLWPGNVRELRNAVERAVLLCPSGKLIGPSHLPASTPGEAHGGGSWLREKLSQTERETLEQALTRHGGVVRRAAKELGLDPVTFARRARKLGLLKGDRGGP